MDTSTTLDALQVPWYKRVFHPINQTRARLYGWPVAILLHAFGFPMVAFPLYVMLALTDATDGFCARRWNLMTAIGHKLDQTADKVFFLSIFAYFFLVRTYLEGVSPIYRPSFVNWKTMAWTMFTVLVAIEIVNMAPRWLESVRRYLSDRTSKFGKWKTRSMGAAAGGMFLGGSFGTWVATIFFAVALVLAFLSMVNRIRFVRDGR